MNVFDKQQIKHRDARIKIINETLSGIKVIKLYAWDMSFIEHPLSGFATIVPILQNAIVSYRRLHKFMLADEIDLASVERTPYDRTMGNTSASDEMVNITNGTFKWLPTDKPALTNVNIQCKRSELVAIIGQVGCGKSSLASAILGDMIKQSGSAMVRGSIAYVPQQPWILNATLRDNILFGSCYDESFYNQVIDACALRPDIDALSSGDMTEIGEKGINLSGGQNMRVSLARAVYARADLYVLDDPLAAVDAHVSQHIFTNVLGPQGLLQSRARILVTNAMQCMHSVDNIVLLSEGNVLEQMSFAQAMSTQGAIYEFIHKYIGNDGIAESKSHSSEAPTDDYSTPTRQSIGYAKPAVISRLTRKRNREALLAESDSHIGRTTTDEVSQKGKVKMSVYGSYAKACGLQNVALFFIVLILASTASIGSNIWLKHWASINDKANSVGASMQPVAKYGTYYLIVYGILELIHTLMNSLKSFVLWTRCSIRASSEIHDNMLTSVMRSPMSFFDVTPIGRIINRFSSDLARLDDMLPRSIFDITNTFTKIAAAAIVISYTTPLILLLVPPLLIFYRKDQQRFLYSSRELRRLESTTRSPIIAHILESINGMSTIRAYGQQSRFLIENENRLALNIRANYNLLFTNRWLAMRLDAVGNFIVFGTSVLSVASAHWFGKGDAALVGLAVSYAVELTHSVNMSIRFYTNMENSMTHVERATEYTQLPSEADTVIEDHRPKQAWPEQGTLEFKNYSTRYREGLDLVLKDLSFRVQPRQKVGIVGRTGAGKSSLTLALFRIIEAASGQILLDGEDISQYGLFDVRSKLSIIPQDPMLFAGTVRENLDPLNSYSDQDIWRVLEQAHLADYIRSKDERLEFMVAQGGENFSVGQRQLICLARALLKRAKVLVLDEATAAIDNATDETIQQTIRTEFKDCTVLTIAHRLNTVIDSDMVLVIDGGQVAEYDTPQNLLANEDSFLLVFSTIGDFTRQSGA
ncbi:hypothetical protein H4R20_000345 [Coemansia guatemalensis]|uniref:P-loop containing nucleoside triphosphate hydrolase protein n=1 Tax=Coemansia guatemalensis TaxID=2761395 RepID=A0A9W8LWR2_9FUNG|nr:hypothetical protein H4R20_000345 [Coemansia guatemalensis]